MKKAYIVVGLGFGDEGKGITTDYLCSKSGAKTVAIRYSGGQQAGHNVVIGDKSHIHASFASGTLRGCASYFTEHCCFYFNAYALEQRVLMSKGVKDPISTIHPRARLTTPMDVAYNKVKSRGKGNSVGMGIGATMDRHEKTGHKIFAIDLTNPFLLTQKMRNIMEYYENKISYEGFSQADQEEFKAIAAYEMGMFVGHMEAEDIIVNIRDYHYLLEFDTLVFEGSQGIMLDMDHGVFPDVTYANTTSRNAVIVCQMLGIQPEIYYTTRCYQTRHGNGFMSNETPVSLVRHTESETNVSNEFQGDFRIAELDLDLLKYAIGVDDIYTHGLRKNLVVTCVDQRINSPSGYSVFDDRELGYNFHNVIHSLGPDSKYFVKVVNEGKRATEASAEELDALVKKVKLTG